MSKDNQHTTPLPLDTLIERLTLAGYTVSPRQRLQLWKTLKTFGPQALQQPSQLKYRLAPIIATKAAEQQQLYTLFDQYLADIQQYQPPAPPPKWWAQLPAWAWAAMLLLPLAIGAWLLRDAFQPSIPPLLQAQHPPEAVLGQPIDIENRSAGYEAATFRWELQDANTKALEQQSSEQRTWPLTIQEAGDSPDKTLVLIAQQGNAADTFRSSLRLLCPQPPAYSRILAPADTLAGATLRFRLPEPQQPGLSYEWAFGDGATAQGYAPTYAYPKAGGYELRLLIRDTTAQGYCEQRLQHRISIQDENEPYAFLTLGRLQQDEPLQLRRLGPGAWLLLLLLLLAAAYFWYRWLLPPPPPPAEQKGEALAAQFAAADRAPYHIPYRPQDSLLRAGPELYRLAQALRRRQQGLRLSLDIPATLERTIAQGGMTELQFRRDSLPPDYLFLIDEQAPHSHQAQLYRYLLDFLRGQDVHIEAFWYKRTPDRCWNAQHPKGISLEQLQRSYPHYRLLLMGDAHALLDPLAQDEHRVQPELAAAYRRWKNRLLLTPLPATDWTYREAALYELLAVFPAYSSGVQAAMAYLEAEQEEEDERARPGFRDWQAAHSQPPQPPAANYRQWQRPATYQAYFEGRPGLYRWCCALMVCPAPTWPLTLAIGRAIGAPVTFDSLLMLSRLPCLQGQPIPLRLRLELLHELDAETERLARAALAEELRAVAPAVQGGHANRELQAQLALQEFLLQPEDEAAREGLRYLLSVGALSKRERAEAEQALARQLAQQQAELEMTQKSAPTKSSSAPPPLRLEDYLGEAPDSPPPAPAPRRLNADFYRALACTLALLLLALAFGWLANRAAPGPAEEGLLLRAQPQADSALLYHNRAVAAWDSLLRQGQELLPGQLQPLADDLERALVLRPDGYPLAADNAARNRYHRAVLHYHAFLQTREAEARERAAADLAQLLQAEAGGPVLQQDARHALGLIAYYRQDRPQAEVYHAELLAAGFFDTLALQPNLRTLLFPNEGAAILSDCLPPPALSLLSSDTLCPGDSLRLRIAPEAAVDYYLVRWGDGQADTLPQEGGTFAHAYRLASGPLRLQVLAFGRCAGQGEAYRIVQRTLAVLPAPRAQAQLSVSRGCPPLEVAFQVPGRAAADYYWDFGNGQQSTQLQPSATYTEPGRYTLRLILRNACGADTLTLADAVEVLSPADCRTVFDLSGRVLGQGKGLPNARIAAGPLEGFQPDLAPYTSSSGPDGRFLLKDLPEGTAALRFRIRAPGYVDTVFTYRELARELEVVMRERGEDSPPPSDPDPPLTTAIAKLEADMVRVAGGSFTMGCESASRDGECYDREKPPRPNLQVNTFSIGKHEVTQAQWRAVMGSDPPELHNKGCDDCPVERVSWNDIQDFLRKLNELTGKRYRLPTEAEWEYAARGGAQSRGFLYSGSNNIDEVAWYTSNARSGNTHGSEKTTRPVGQKKANELGLYDMSGNVWEWCEDDWHDNYDGAPTDGRAWVDSPRGGRRVLRGGSWSDGTRYCRVANRNWSDPSYRYDLFGFRLARD